MDFKTELSTSHAQSLHEDPMVTIERRLEEVKMMTRSKNRGEEGILGWLPEERRNFVMELKDMPIAQLKKMRRKGWKLQNYIRWVVKMLKILIPAFIRRKLYYIDTEAKKQTKEEQMQQTSMKFVRIRCSMGHDLHIALITAPRYRSNFMIKKIKWLLKATKAFTHLFPAEMETEVAKRVGYEAYDDGRIIAHQGRKPERFYYIVTGRVSIMQQYQLSTGKVNKSLGLLSKGMTSDAEEMEKQWIRSHSLIAKGKVEVLLLDRKDFMFLQRTNQGPPVEFLRSIDLFGEFPLEKFNEFPDATEYKYYAQGKVIVHDSNRTPFIHVVKSGQVKVMRFQTVYDAALCNGRKFNSRTEEGLGCGKSSSHAKAMLGLSYDQRLFKKQKGDLTLPKISTSIDGFKSTRNPFARTLGVEVSLHTGVGADRSSTPLIYRSKAPSHRTASERSFHEDPRTQSVVVFNEGGGGGADDVDAYSQSGTGTVDESPAEAPSSGANGNHNHTTTTHAHGGDTTGGGGPNSAALKRRERRHQRSASLGRTMTSSALSPQETDDVISGFRPHSLYMTREKTENTTNTLLETPSAALRRDRTTLGGSKAKLGGNDVTSDMNFYRKAYLQLDLLNPGDIFGLDHMRTALASEGRGVSLLSDGAEVVRVNKRFFVQHAGNNTMLKLDTLHKDYIGEEEAKNALYEKETWGQYKDALWSKLTSKLPDIHAQ